MTSLRDLLDAKLLKERAGVARSHPAAGVANMHPVDREESTSSPGSNVWGRGLVHREGTRAVEGSSRPSPAPASGRGVTFGAEHRAPPPSGRLNKSPLVDAAKAPAKTGATETARFESLAEEEQALRLAAASALLEFLTPEVYLKWLKLPGGPGSRIPASSADPKARAVARLADLSTGGKTGTKNDDLRRCLSDITRYNSAAGVVGGLWPLKADHAEAARIWLQGEDPILPAKAAEPTAAARLLGALAYARELGLPVEEIPTAMAGVKRPRVQRTVGDKARGVPPPILIVQLDAAARGGVLGDPATIYVQLIYWDLLLQARGRDLHASEVIAPDASDPARPVGVLHTLNFLDKNDRADVHQWAPWLSLVDGAPLPWAPALVDRLAGACEFTFPDWVSAGTGKHGVLDATELVLKGDGSLSYCKKKRAASQITPIVARVAGRTVAELAAENLSGTHWMRNLGGDVSSYLDWPDKDADILGDWATPEPQGPQDPALKRARGKASKSTRQKFYRANAPRDEQIEVRTRFYQAVAAAIQAFGIPNLTWETTWRELVPPQADAPASLLPFYGPRAGHAPTPALTLTSP